MEKTDQKAGNPLWANVFRNLNKAKEQSKIDLISRIPIFKDLNRRELRTVTDFLYDRTYESGEDIFLADQPGAAMFIITSGRVNILIDHDDGTSTELAKLQDGDFFGEIALLDSSPRSANARAAEKTRMLSIFRADLEKLMYNEPFIAAKIIKHLAIIIGLRLKETNKQLRNLSQKIEKLESNKA